LLYQILLNLSFDEGYYKLLKLITISAYDKNLREIKKQGKHALIGNRI
jgi:hypothetical protein